MLLVALRLIAALTAVQFSGLPHVMADVVAFVEGEDEHGDCPNDEQGRECPPGCPACHCVHSMSALPPIAPILTLERLLGVEIAVAPYDAQGPPAPPIAAIYRPPRRILG